MGPETLLDLPIAGPAPSRVLLTARGPALWPALSAEDLRSRAAELAAGLAGYGLDPGRSLGIVCEPGPDLAVAVLAAARAGAKAVVLDSALGSHALAGALRERGVVQVIAGNDRILGSVLSVRPDLPDLDLVLVACPDPSERPSPALRVDAACSAGASSIARGEAAGAGGPVEPVLEVVGRGAGRRIWTHAGLLLAAERLAAALALSSVDVVFARLPATHDDFAPLLAACLVRGAHIVFEAPEASSLSLGTLGETRATIAAIQAADLDTLHAEIVAGGRAPSWAGRKLRAWALVQGRDPLLHPRAHRVAETLVLRGIRSPAGPGLRKIQVLGRPAAQAAIDVLRAVGFTVENPSAASA